MSMIPDPAQQAATPPPPPPPPVRPPQPVPPPAAPPSRVEQLLEQILAALKSGPPAPPVAAPGGQAPAYPELSVEGLIISADQWANHWATFKRSDEGLQVVAPAHAIASPLQWVDSEHGRWSIIPLRLASGKEQLVGVLPADQGGSVGAPFEGQFGETEGVPLVFVRSWCNVSGWEKSPAVRAREQARAAAPAPAAPAAQIEEPF